MSTWWSLLELFSRYPLCYSLQLIWWSGTHRFHLRAPAHQMSCWHLITWLHDDVMKRKHFPRYWPIVRGIHRSPVNFTHKGQWHRYLMFSSICAWINGWVNTAEAGDLRRHRAHIDVTLIGTRIVVSVMVTSWHDPLTPYNISQEICTRFCCALLCCGYAIVHNEFTWSIYPYSSGLLCWHWGNR